MNKLKYTFIDTETKEIKIAYDMYKNEVKDNFYKYILYSVGKGYGDLKMAKELSLDDLIEAFQALVLFNEQSKG